MRVSPVLVAVALVGLLGVLFGGAEAQQYCSGLTTLTDTQGWIADHTGGGNYQDEVTCTWIVTPAGSTADTRVQFQFHHFEVEYGFDYVYFWDNPVTGASASRIFTGYQIPLPFESVGPSFALRFQSDQLVNFRGFNISYHVVNCPNGCTDRGYCENTGVCTCDPGWTGADCSQRTCSSSLCINGGTCNVTSQACVCPEGFYGGDCGDPYCEANHLFTADTGLVTDHRGGGDYLDSSSCQWEINPSSPADSILLQFNRFDTEDDWDFVYVYDGIGRNSSKLLAELSGSSLPPRITAVSGQMTVVFESDLLFSSRGFEATYRAVRCPNSCSGKGFCIEDNVCHCVSGWLGSDCSVQGCTENCHGHGICQNTTCTCTEPGWSGPDCGTCSSNATCAVNFCSGTQVLANSTGSFSDHSGSSDYAANSDCTWEFAPSASHTNIHVMFNKIDLEPDQAFVRVFDGDASNHQIGEYSGFFQSVPPVVSSTDLASVRFTSSASTNTAGGVSGTYMAVTCPGSCGFGKGHCNMDGTCDCLTGYGGAACNETACVGDCSPNGVCDTQENKCSCSSGWFGPACLESHCSGSTKYTATSGVVKDHSVGDTYSAGSNCEFVIEPAGILSTDTISLQFDSVILGTGAFLNVINETSGQPLITFDRFSIFDRTAPFRVPGPRVRLTFTAPIDQFPMTGFSVRYSLTRACPGGCSGKGSCVDGVCICDVLSSGADCSLGVVPTVLAANDVWVQRTVKPWEWVYYEVTVDRLSDQLSVSYGKVAGEDAGWPLFFLRRTSYPTGTNTGSQTDVFRYFWETVMMLARSLSVGEKHYVGIQNQDLKDAVVQVKAKLECPSDCGNGVCDINAGRCLCTSCYSGETCQNYVCTTTGSGSGSGSSSSSTTTMPPTTTTSISTTAAISGNNAQSTSGSGDGDGGSGATIAIVIIIILLIVCCALVVGFFYIRRRKKQDNADIALQRRQALERDGDSSTETDSSAPSIPPETGEEPPAYSGSHDMGDDSDYSSDY